MDEPRRWVGRKPIGWTLVTSDVACLEQAAFMFFYTLQHPAVELMEGQRCLPSPTTVFGEGSAVSWVSYSMWVCGLRGPTYLCGICFPLISPCFPPPSLLPSLPSSIPPHLSPSSAPTWPSLHSLEPPEVSAYS